MSRHRQMAVWTNPFATLISRVFLTKYSDVWAGQLILILVKPSVSGGQKSILVQYFTLESFGSNGPRVELENIVNSKLMSPYSETVQRATAANLVRFPFWHSILAAIEWFQPCYKRRLCIPHL